MAQDETSTQAADNVPLPVPIEDGPRVSGHDRLRTAMQRLDDALIAPVGANGQWTRAVLRAVRELESAFQRHREVSEAPGGTLERVIAARPSLVAAARRSRSEHPLLLDRMAVARERISAGIDFGQPDPEAVRSELGRLQDEVRRHVGRGSDLLFEAFFRDDGGEG